VENRLSLGVETRKSAKRIGKTKQNNKGSETYQKSSSKSKAKRTAEKSLDSPQLTSSLKQNLKIFPSQNNWSKTGEIT
jgi:hypothetical protein